MLIVSADAAWTARLLEAAGRLGWNTRVAPRAGAPAVDGEESLLAVVDASSRTGVSREVAELRRARPGAWVAVACGEEDLAPGRVESWLSCGADGMLDKRWSRERLSSALSALRDRALAAAGAATENGGLRLDRRARRAWLRAGGRERDLGLTPGEFDALWLLVSGRGGPVSRARLAQGRPGSVPGDPERAARRLASLRRKLRPWGGRIETVRGEGYRLAPPAGGGPSRRRSTT